MFTTKHLLDEIADLRRQRDFFQGKCERLEMAMMAAQTTTAAQEFVARSEPTPIEETKVETPAKKNFAQIRQWWSTLTDEEQDKAMGVKEPEPKPEVLQ